jgi:molybdopterin/thiamine biosynthesis adenylyltransferase
MSRLDIIEYDDELFEEVKKDFEKECDSKMIRVEGEFEWEHQVTDDRVRLVNPWFVVGHYGGLYLVKKVEERKSGASIRTFFEYLYHANLEVCCGYWTGSKYRIWAPHFCTNNFNKVDTTEFFKDYDVNIQTLKILIPQQNPSSAYQVPMYSMCMTELDFGVLDLRYKEDNILNLLCMSHSPNNEQLSDLRTQGYYYKPKDETRYYYTLNLKDIRGFLTSGRLSKHYKIINCKKLHSLLDNFKYKYDMMCVGCGSSGSNFAYQLSKTKLVNSMALVDGDCVERKNLRNTTFNTSDTGGWKNKANRLMSKIKVALPETEAIRTVDVYHNYIERVFGKFETEFLFSGVDKLTVRRELLEHPHISSRYIIDAGYQGLSSSIYIIDREDEEQVEYYKAYLDNSIKNYVDDVIPNFSNLDRWQWRNLIRWNYGDRHKEYDMTKSQWMKHSDKWKKKAWSLLSSKDKEGILSKLEASRQTCQSPNIIDIYTITSGILVGVVREIKNGKDKPFTHLEVDTSTGIPLTMVVRK